MIALGNSFQIQATFAPENQEFASRNG